MRFFVHGAGRAGREAWPEQSAMDAVFADHSTRSLMASKADAVGEQCPRGDVVVVAHSLGAVPTALAYQARRLAASHMVLLEPAVYDIARGAEAIERHIDAMTGGQNARRRG